MGSHRPMLARQLAVLRAATGMNQVELARAAGVHGSSISTYEGGVKVPEWSTVARLLGAMDFHPAALERARLFLLAVDGDAGANLEEMRAAGVRLAQGAGRAVESAVLAFLQLGGAVPSPLPAALENGALSSERNRP